MSDIIEFNYETGQITNRDYTEEEIDVNQAVFDQTDEMLLQVPAPDQSAIDNLESAINKLTLLGLTIDEAKAIAGIRSGL